MEQILTIQEERKFIAEFIKKRAKARSKYDEFSGKLYTEIRIYNFISIENTKDIQLRGLTGETATPSFILEFSLYKDEKYELSSFQFLIKKTDGTFIELPKNKAKIKSEFHKKERLSVAYNAYSFELNLTEEVARALTKKGTKVCVQYNDERFIGETGQFGYTKDKAKIDLRYFVDMVILLNEKRSLPSKYSDELIDDIYDYCQQIIKNEEKAHDERIRRESEVQEKKKTELIRVAENKYNRAISISVNPHEFDVLEKLFFNPAEIPVIKALKVFCDKNEIICTSYEWLFSISENYDKTAILENVRQCRTEYEKKCSKFLVRCGLKTVSKQDVTYNEKTLEFIKDFEKRFPKR